MPRYDLVAMARRPTPASAAASSYATSYRRLSWRPNLSRETCARVIAAWADALPRINTAYERTLSELTTDSPADVRAEIDGVAEAINRLVMILAPEVRCWALSVERWHRGKRRGTLLSATGVDLEAMLGPEDVRATLETSIESNVALIKDVNQQAHQQCRGARLASTHGSRQAASPTGSPGAEWQGIYRCDRPAGFTG